MEESYANYFNSVEASEAEAVASDASTDQLVPAFPLDSRLNSPYGRTGEQEVGGACGWQGLD